MVKSKVKQIVAVVLLFALTLSVFSACSDPNKKNAWYKKGDYKSTVGSASDYSLTSNWLSIPTISHEVDVVYLYSSCYDSDDACANELSEINDEGMRQNAKVAYEEQATVFENSCNVFAPFYRQYNLNDLKFDNRDDLYSYLAKEPRTDVFAALDYYFENYNNGRPFILAGHSQGSVLLNMVLSEYMSAKPEYYSRMIVAYQIGYSVSQEWLDANPHIVMASGETDTGVVASWCTEALTNLGKANIFVLDNSVCINPINWSTSDLYVPKSQNLGSRIKNENGEYEIVTDLADAKINTTRGTVINTSVNPDIYASKRTQLYGDGSYLDYDYGFYYMNIQDNVQKRINSYFSSHNSTES